MMQNSWPRIHLTDDQFPTAIDPEHGSDSGTAFIDARRLTRMLWAVVLIGIAARAARFFLCFPLWEDEAYLGTNFLTRDYLQLAQGLDNTQVAPLLYLWTVETFVNWFGFTEHSLRLVAFLSSIASLLLFVVATRRIYDGVPWLLSVGFFAVAYRAIRHGAELKPYSSDAFCGLILLTLLIYWISSERRNVWLWAMTLSIPLLVGLSFPFVFLAGAVSVGIAWELWRNGDRRGLLPWGALNVSLIGSFLLFCMLTTNDQIDTNLTGMSHHWAGAFPPIDRPWHIVPWLVDAILGDMFPYPIGGSNGASSLTVLFIVVGACVLARRNWSALPVVFLTALVLQFIASLMHRYPFGGSSRLMMHLAPMACLLAGLGAARLIIWRLPKTGRLIGSWTVYAFVALFLLIGSGSIVRDFAKPYKYHDMLNERAFARWFWYNQAYDAELVCIYTDRESLDAPDQEVNSDWAVYLCNQALYSQRHHRKEPPDLSRVSADHPLRCVHYDPGQRLIGAAGPRHPKKQAVGEWFDRLKTRYRLVHRQVYRFPYHYPGHPTLYRAMEVFDFVPLDPDDE